MPALVHTSQEEALLFERHAYATPAKMFANLLQLLTRRPTPPEEYDLAFVKEVSVRTKPPREPRVERVILVCWVLIALKCWLVTWLIHKYQVPVHPMWVIAPTIVFALVCTFVYWLRE